MDVAIAHNHIAAFKCSCVASISADATASNVVYVRIHQRRLCAQLNPKKPHIGNLSKRVSIAEKVTWEYTKWSRKNNRSAKLQNHLHVLKVVALCLVRVDPCATSLSDRYI